MVSVNVTPPLFISSRLMAALTIEGDTGGIVNLEHTGSNREGRQTYRWLIETHDHVVVGLGDGPNSGCGDAPDYTSMMATLLNFLDSDAASYRHHMGDGEPDDGYMFPPTVTEWAYMNSDQLGVLAYELANPDGEEG